MHGFAAMKYFQVHGKFYLENGKSKLNLANVMEFCGMKDTRIQLKDKNVVKEGTPHNGLEDAKLEADCLSRILFGKGLFKEFDHFKVPWYLRKI